jgi:hypothetical protein
METTHKKVIIVHFSTKPENILHSSKYVFVGTFLKLKVKQSLNFGEKKSIKSHFSILNSKLNRVAKIVTSGYELIYFKLNNCSRKAINNFKRSFYCLFTVKNCYFVSIRSLIFHQY